jgi:hypothetical protein
MGLEHAAEHGHGERGVIDVGVARDEHDIGGIPAPRADLLRGGRQPALVVP